MLHQRSILHVEAFGVPPLCHSLQAATTNGVTAAPAVHNISRPNPVGQTPRFLCPQVFSLKCFACQLVFMNHVTCVFWAPACVQHQCTIAYCIIIPTASGIIIMHASACWRAASCRQPIGRAGQGRGEPGLLSPPAHACPWARRARAQLSACFAISAAAWRSCVSRVHVRRSPCGLTSMLPLTPTRIA